LSIGKIHKFSTIKNPVFVQNYLLTFSSRCVIIIMSRGEANEVEGWVPSRGVQIPWKTFQKDLEKPLDKPLKMWYYNSVKRDRENGQLSYNRSPCVSPWLAGRKLRNPLDN
jgi:hypothetical protein